MDKSEKLDGVGGEGIVLNVKEIVFKCVIRSGDFKMFYVLKKYHVDNSDAAKLLKNQFDNYIKFLFKPDSTLGFFGADLFKIDDSIFAFIGRFDTRESASLAIKSDWGKWLLSVSQGLDGVTAADIAWGTVSWDLQQVAL